MLSGSKSHDQDSVATAANAVREAIVLMSVHEERANVRGSIQAENAEASSLLLFSTNLSDKELWERPQPTWTSWHYWLCVIKAYYTQQRSDYHSKQFIFYIKAIRTRLQNKNPKDNVCNCLYVIYRCTLCNTLFTRNKRADTNQLHLCTQRCVTKPHGEGCYLLFETLTDI